MKVALQGASGACVKRRACLFIYLIILFLLLSDRCGARGAVQHNGVKMFISQLEESIPSGSSAIKVATCGFISSSARSSVLSSIMKGCGYDALQLSSLQMSDTSQILSRRHVLPSVYTDGGNNRVVALCAVDAVDEPACDVAFVYISETAHLDEDALLLRLQNALRSVLGAENEPKKTLVLLTPSSLSGEKLATHQKYCLGMTQAAYAMMNKEMYRNEEVSVEMNIRLASVESVQAIGALLSTVFESRDSSAPKSAAGLFVNTNVRVGESPTGSLKEGYPENSALLQQSGGMEACREGVSSALTWARKGATASIEKLKELQSKGEFAVFVENLMNGAIDVFKADIANSQLANDGKISPSVIKIAEQDLRSSIMAMMLPFFRHQAQLIRQAIIDEFNEVAVEEIELSVNILQDLHAAKQKSLRDFAKRLKSLVPASMRGGNLPSSWNTDYDVQQLRDVLEDYIHTREVQSKLQGILPRDRKPIEISFHTFFTHPFGRDYRQEVISTRGEDFLFDEVAAKEKDVTVSPAIARAILKRTADEASSGENIFFSNSDKRSLQKNAEFAREMLMFPLSIKNPGVPLMGSGRRRKGADGPPKKDVNRERLGPDRFIRWDVEPMDIIKEDLEDYLRSPPPMSSASSSSSSSSASPASGRGNPLLSALDLHNILDQLPFFPSKYKHPPINYGSNKNPSLSS